MISEGNVVKDKYNIIRQLGQGGMAQVWLAEEINFRNRQVAIKVPRPGLSEQEGAILNERFKREVNVCAELAIAETPNIVKALTFETLDNNGFLVMEYMPGGDLEQRISDHPEGMPIEDTLKIAKEILIALDAIHNHPQAIIHRDIKPSNILFNNKDEACIGDFGLAQMSKNSGLLSQVLSGQVLVFTPRYRAPELDNPNAYINNAADIFSFGCVLWEMLTGKVYKDYGKPPSTFNDQVPEWLDEMLMQCLAKDPLERLLHAEEVFQFIDRHPKVTKKKTSQKPKPKKTEPIISFPKSESKEKKETKETKTKLGIGSKKVCEKDGMTMVYVPAGEFLMGSSKNDSDADENEKPQHTVYLDAYWIDKTLVTNTMYAKFLNEMGNRKEIGIYWMPTKLLTRSRISQVNGFWQVMTGFEDHPVTQIKWFGAQAYIQWAGKRLPTEAEWEKAARGTDGGTYPWGNGIVSDLANYNTNKEYPKTSPVGHFLKGASPYGALDMAGNVWEWVGDWFDKNYYKNSPKKNPHGPSSGNYRVLRGGSWDSSGRGARSAYRYDSNPAYAGYYLGFRCALRAASP